MNNHIKTFSLPLLTLILSILVTSCEVEVPIKEMALAKNALTRAFEVKAKKYAPEELTEAQQHLYNSHKLAIDEKTDDAKTEAEKALEFANKAIEISLPPLAVDTLKEALAVRDEAITLFAEKYAPDELKLSNDEIELSQTLLGEKRYYDSYLMSMEAIANANAARDKALTNIPALKEWASTIANEAANLEANRGNEFAPDELTRIKTLISEAEPLLNESSIKEAFPKLNEADQALKAATLKVDKGIAISNIKIAEESLGKLKASRHHKLFSKEIEESGALIDSSKSDLKSESYHDSFAKSQAAIELLNSVFIAMEKRIEDARLDYEARGEDDGMTEYVVKLSPGKRDCLWRIAQYVYKDAKLWPLIYMANKDQIKDPDLIFPGQKFKIPPIPTREKEGEAEEKEDAAIIEESTSEEKGEVPGEEKTSSDEAAVEEKPAAEEDAVEDKADEKAGVVEEKAIADEKTVEEKKTADENTVEEKTTEDDGEVKEELDSGKQEFIEDEEDTPLEESATESEETLEEEVDEEDLPPGILD